jgi:hypothetical protein
MALGSKAGELDAKGRGEALLVAERGAPPAEATLDLVLF